MTLKIKPLASAMLIALFLASAWSCTASSIEENKNPDLSISMIQKEKDQEFPWISGSDHVRQSVSIAGGAGKLIVFAVKNEEEILSLQNLSYLNTAEDESRKFFIEENYDGSVSVDTSLSGAGNLYAILVKENEESVIECLPYYIDDSGAVWLSEEKEYDFSINQNDDMKLSSLGDTDVVCVSMQNHTDEKNLLAVFAVDSKGSFISMETEPKKRISYVDDFTGLTYGIPVSELSYLVESTEDGRIYAFVISPQGDFYTESAPFWYGSQWGLLMYDF